MMYDAKELTLKESMVIVIGQALKGPIDEHKDLRKRVNKYLKGQISSNLFIVSMVAGFIRRLVKDGLMSIGVCTILGLDTRYVLIFLIVRGSLFINTILRMVIDENIKKRVSR